MWRLRNFAFTNDQFAILRAVLAIPLVVVGKSQLPPSSARSRIRAAPSYANAEVTARNQETGLTRTVTSNDEEAYRI
jgi:hypothetical protein